MKRVGCGLVLWLLAASMAIAAELPLTEYLKPWSIRSVCFSPDEDELAFVSDKSGRWQPYLMGVTGGRWVRIVQTEDNVSGVTWSPIHRDRLFFLMDHQNDGRPHLYQVWMQARRYQDETKFPNVTAAILGWSRDGNFLYYTGNPRGDSLIDVYRYDVDNWRSELIFENPGAYAALSLSPDSRSLILTREPTTPLPRKYEFVLAEKSLHPVLSGDSDAFPEFAPLAPANAPRVSFHGDFVTQAVIDGRRPHWKTVVKSTGQVLRYPREIPGALIPLGFSRSGRYLLLKSVADTLPGNVWLWDAGKNSVLKLTNGLENSTVTPSLLIEATPLAVVDADKPAFTAALYLPTDSLRRNPCPLLIDVTSRADLARGYDGWIQFLLSRGFAVLAADIRDPSALDALRARSGTLSGIDTTRVMLWAHDGAQDLIDRSSPYMQQFRAALVECKGCKMTTGSDSSAFLQVPGKDLRTRDDRIRTYQGLFDFLIRRL